MWIPEGMGSETLAGLAFVDSFDIDDLDEFETSANADFGKSDA
jgi:hypothetical protein